MIRPRFSAQPEVSTRECRPEFRNEFFGGIEHGVTAGKQQTRSRLGRIVAVVSFGRIVGELPEHNQRGLFALADLGATFLPLLVGAPFATLVTLSLRSGPEAHGINTPVR